jgi:hypothetical protein
MSTSGKVQLTATALDKAAEVFIIDSKLDLVDRGIGRVVTHQPPGVYKIKVRAGQATHEELVVLEKEAVHKTLDHLMIPSAAPLHQTSQSHEYHQEAAVKESAHTRVRIGSGASIFMFARDWTPSGDPPRSGHHPAEGLTLKAVSGGDLVDFQKQAKADLRLDPCAACRVEVNPGAYVLAVTTANGQCFQMIVVAAAGWQTQIFLLQRDEPSSQRGRRPDLASASVMLSKSGQFSPDATDDRLAELARLALVDRRKVLTGELMDLLLHNKYKNPMLGIVGAHLLLRQEKPDTKLIQTVIRNLRSRVLPTQPPHPDVEALAVAAGEEPKCDFSIPPMLRDGWNAVVKACLKRPELIPDGSLSARIATRVTNQNPWLIWRTPSDGSQDWEAHVADDFRDFLTNAVIAPKTGGPLAVAARTIAMQSTKVMADVLLERVRQRTLGGKGTAKDAGSAAAVDQLAMSLAPMLKLPPATVRELISRAALRVATGSDEDAKQK